MDEGGAVDDEPSAPERGSDPTAATAQQDASPASRPPSKAAWAALLVLAVGAIAIPFTHRHVLIQDDFNQAEVLRAWPEDDTSFAYVDGEYHVSVSPSLHSSFGRRKLPRPVSGVDIAIDARAVRGHPAIVVECISEVTEHASPDDPNVTITQVASSYLFFSDPARGSYGIGATATGAVLSSGSIASGDGGRLSVGCVAGSGGTKLRMQVGDSQPVEVTDPNGLNTFRGIGLGAVAKTSSEVAFDNLRVVEAG